MMAISAERLAKVFVECADTLVDEFDLLEFLHMLTTRVGDLVDASAVGLLLADQRGNLQFMAASEERAELLELFQVQAREGPCLEAFRTGRPVINADLRDATARWPRFAPRAAQAGFRSVHAFPLRLRAETIGALNVFGNAVGGGFDDADVDVVQALADVAAIGLLQQRAISRGEILTEQLQGALNSRIIIEQAKGMIAQARHITVDAAFATIRDYARRRNLRLSDLAHTITAEPDTVPELFQPLETA